jgi:hypothetical protein
VRPTLLDMFLLRHRLGPAPATPCRGPAVIRGEAGARETAPIARSPSTSDRSAAKLLCSSALPLMFVKGSVGSAVNRAAVLPPLS